MTRFPTYDEMVATIPADAPWFRMTDAERRDAMERRRVTRYMSDEELLRIAFPGVEPSEVTDEMLKAAAGETAK